MMPRTTLLDTDYATLYYYPEDKIVHHSFHKFIFGQEFRNVLDTGLEAFKKHGAQKWLSDDRKNSALPAEDGDWSATDWLPRAVDAGWKYWAIIMPDKVIGQMNMNRLMKPVIEQGLEIKVFEHTEDALDWLKSV